MAEPKFRVGDQVRVITDYWGYDQLGADGTVIYIHEDEGLLPIGVRYSKLSKYNPEGRNAYRPEDLELLTPRTMLPSPEFSLEEIGLAQELMEGS